MSHSSSLTSSRCPRPATTHSFMAGSIPPSGQSLPGNKEPLQGLVVLEITAIIVQQDNTLFIPYDEQHKEVREHCFKYKIKSWL